MTKLLIAYNNDTSVPLHRFFESCADAIKQSCANEDIDYVTVVPPELHNGRLLSVACDCDLCFVASHGTSDALINECQEDIVSVHTDNYIFDGKIFYSIACLTARCLKDSLLRSGVSSYWGYSDEFTVYEAYEHFVDCAVKGALELLSGNDPETAKEEMLKKYDECIAELEALDVMAAAALLDNKESLVVEIN